MRQTVAEFLEEIGLCGWGRNEIARGLKAWAGTGIVRLAGRWAEEICEVEDVLWSGYRVEKGRKEVRAFWVHFVGRVVTLAALGLFVVHDWGLGGGRW